MSYLQVISTLWLILVAYWIFSARGNKPTVSRIDPTWRALSLSAIVAQFLLFRAYPGFFRRHLYFPTDSCRAAGVFICAAGVAFAIGARHTLGRNWSGSPTIKEGHELVESGPYRYVRHPIYTGILLAAVGTGFGSGQTKHLFIVSSALVILWTKLRIEESLMLRQFPQSYPGYMRRTKALIPFLL
jgi:protein-S-isoprenylcysteine O-methyltransferase Ste14